MRVASNRTAGSGTDASTDYAAFLAESNIESALMEGKVTETVKTAERAKALRAEIGGLRR